MRIKAYILALVWLCTTVINSAYCQYNSMTLSEKWLETDTVILQGLDKGTAKVFTSEVKVNQQVKFGTLEMYVRASFTKPPEETPETICFIEIYENKHDEARDLVFAGWMFASNPALTDSLEHPVYDIWVKGVKLPITPPETPKEPILEPEELKQHIKESETDEDSQASLW